MTNKIQAFRSCGITWDYFELISLFERPDVLLNLDFNILKFSYETINQRIQSYR